MMMLYIAVIKMGEIVKSKTVVVQMHKSEARVWAAAYIVV